MDFHVLLQLLVLYRVGLNYLKLGDRARRLQRIADLHRLLSTLRLLQRTRTGDGMSLAAVTSLASVVSTGSDAEATSVNSTPLFQLSSLARSVIARRSSLYRRTLNASAARMPPPRQSTPDSSYGTPTVVVDMLPRSMVALQSALQPHELSTPVHGPALIERLPLPSPFQSPLGPVPSPPPLMTSVETYDTPVTLPSAAAGAGAVTDILSPLQLDASAESAPEQAGGAVEDVRLHVSTYICSGLYVISCRRLRLRTRDRPLLILPIPTICPTWASTAHVAPVPQCSAGVPA